MNSQITKHTVHSYDLDLQKLTDQIIEMSKLAAENIIIAKNSIYNITSNFYDHSCLVDEKINELDTIIETTATTILALRQPVAIDLRHLTAGLKISLILERMGDLAKDVTKRMLNSKIQLEQPILEEIDIMTNNVLEMLENVLTAFKERDKNKAEEILKADSKINEIYGNLLEQMQNRIKKNPSDAESIINIIFAIKRFERLGDYTTKIAKIVHYISAGKRELNQN